MRLITFDEFIANNQEKHPEATGELSGLLRDIGLVNGACESGHREEAFDM